MNRTSRLASLAVGGVLLGGAGLANAADILYNDFASVAGMQLNGSAHQAGSTLRLTSSGGYQSGSAFSTNTVSLASNASFSSAFRFQMTQSAGICDGDGCGADGLVFVVQTVANTAGGAGGGIGYQGLPKSVGIEFDTWNNGWWDDYNGNHVGIDINGNIDSAAQTGVATRMNNDGIWSAWVDYNGATDALEVRLAEGAAALRPVNALLTYTVDLASVLETTNAFVGFTAGTGSAYNNHDILAWQFNSSYQPINQVGAIPEPETYAMLLAGLGLLGAMKRRRDRAAK
jgi:hypothetical protein